MKNLKTFDNYLLEKKVDNYNELISLFSKILEYIEKDLSVNEAFFDKNTLERLLNFAKNKKTSNTLYGFIFYFLKSLIESINSNENISVYDFTKQNCDLNSINKNSWIARYITRKKYGDDISPNNCIKAIIQTLEEHIIDNKASKLEKQYKKILSDSGFSLRSGTRYYDPPDYWTGEDDLEHEPIAASEEIVEILLKYYKPGFSLLDIGAGYGNIMKISKIIGYETTGIELKDTKKYTKGLNIIYDNFFNVNSDIISKFDVIYFYRPLINGSDMELFLDKIYNDAKSGAIIIYGLPHIDQQDLENKYENFKFIKHQDNFIVFSKK